MLSDRFEVLEELGRGPLGQLVRARDRHRDSTVALRLTAETDPARAEVLRDAARRAAPIKHPNVCRVHEAGIDGSTVWVSMELVEGRTLARVLDEDGPFDAARLTQVALEICAGLAALHSCGCLHRHLKPGNVILAPGGAKLIDIGLAHAQGRRADLPYISPEARHRQPVDERTDLYSLGVMLVELATGSSYPAHDEDAPLALPGAVPPALAAVILRLLHVEPGARYRNAPAAAEAFMAAQPASAPPRRRRKLLGIGALVAVLGVVGVVALSRGRGGGHLPAFLSGCGIRF